MTGQLFSLVGVKYEVACDVIGAIIAHYSEAIAIERSKPLPDQAAIGQAQKEKAALRALRDDLNPRDEDAIKRVLEHYSPIAHKLYER